MNEEGLAKLDAAARVFSEALTKLETLVGPGRPLSIVITKLQEAHAFARIGIGLDPRNQVS